jgi:AmpD protein
MHVGPAGLIEGIRYVESPNCDERPPGEPITLLVVHSISLPPGCFEGDAVELLFTNRLDPASHPYYAQLAGVRVSAHFFIRRDGETIQFVPVGWRAWHAGESSWKGRARCNDFSIGVELEGVEDGIYSDAQYLQLSELTRALRATLPLDDLAAHSEIAPGRKNDPGPGFDWPRLRAALRNS